MTTGTFIISLDFELNWGIFDQANLETNFNYFNNTLNTIPLMLKMFEDNNIEVTWAAVGMLFNKDVNEWVNNVPTSVPRYTDASISSYNYAHDTGNIHKYPQYFLASNLIDLIKKTKGQEIGTHTYSHYYCLAEGQTIDNFSDDLQQAVNMAEKRGISINSIVFPRNQFNKSYTEICSKFGIKALRTNPAIWFWDTTKKETLLSKIFRTADCYLPIFNSCFKLVNMNYNENKTLEIPASRFLRPVSKYNLLNKLRLWRAKAEMTNAAKNKLCYHLWWHPHNFGNYPAYSMDNLLEIVNHYKTLEKKYQFKSLNMNGVYNQYINL